MHVSSQALQEFKNLYLQEYGEELDDKTARKKAIGLLEVMKIVYGPLQRPIEGGGVIEYGKTTDKESRSSTGRQD